MVDVICSRCEKPVELGKVGFFCPLIVNLSINYNRIYGDYICKSCCRENFIQNLFNWKTKGWCSGSCHECKFPIGAIEYTEFWFGSDAERNSFLLRKEYKPKRDEKGYISDWEESDKYTFDLSDYRRRYYALKWDDKYHSIRAYPKEVYGGVEELYFKHGKLPTRIIFTFEDCFNRMPLTWYEYTKYYWAEYGHPQNFNEQKWMDKAPVFILPMYYNKSNGATLQERVQDLKEYIEERIKRVGSLYVFEQEIDAEEGDA